MKSVLLIGAGEMQVPLIRQAKKMGYRTVVADFDPTAPGFIYADVVSYASTIDMNAIYNLALSENVDAVCTSSDYPVRTVAYVCEKLGLPGLSQESAEIVTNKYLQREKFSKNKLFTPGYRLIHDKSDLKKCEELHMPLIVKPVDSSASRGVIKIETLDSLTDAYSYAAEYSRTGDVIVEEFIEGREFSVEVLIQNHIPNIIAVTEKFTDGVNNKFFVEEKHLIPARISADEYKEFETVVSKAVISIGLNNSAAHVELKISNRGLFIIEIAGRLGGDYITSDLVPLATGVNMLSNVLEIALGNNINTIKTKNNFAGICFLTPQNYTVTIERIRKMNQNEKIISKEVKEFKDGMELKSSLDRLGHYIFCTNDMNEISKLMQI